MTSPKTCLISNSYQRMIGLFFSEHLNIFEVPCLLHIPFIQVIAERLWISRKTLLMTAIIGNRCKGHTHISIHTVKRITGPVINIHKSCVIQIHLPYAHTVALGGSVIGVFITKLATEQILFIHRYCARQHQSRISAEDISVTDVTLA